ncbi:MAG: tRNA pseudouridine(55) synthase TruB [Alphaproteobacteria bacterium]|jgi:tRNA pseudouridine55 synthase|nr:tRNA pseudouridine(55) synthase TruB [Alphaproteobacteria bacterium]MBT5860232.1 tRNA pseudouridine(55) synthase TruB [Alphaproteobacteria bacterium]
MGRKRKGKPINGWVILDKPLGRSSAWAVGQVRHITGAAKAGHGGTLDPLATGVLPIALGEATKTVSYIQDGTKIYGFVLRWGQATETDDSEGAVVETSDHRPTEAEILAALSAFTGEIAQAPPAYSAIKIDGKRAYALARDGKAPEMVPRIVRVDRFDWRGSPTADTSEFVVECGKGTYIRSLARDLARALGTVGHVASMRRLAVGTMTEKDAISLERLGEVVHSAAPDGYLHPVETALADIPALDLTGPQAQRLRAGQVVQAPNANPGAVCAMADGLPVALGHVEDGEVRAVRVFNL